MSFGKSKVSRFGEKEVFQRSSATDFPSRSRDSARSTKSGKSGIVSSSFAESGLDESRVPRSLAEATQKLRAVARGTCPGSRIGKPNLKRGSIKPKSAKISGSDVHARDSYTTVDSSKSGPPSSRIPRSSLGSRAGSFVASQSSNKSQDFHKRSLEMQYNLKTKRFNSLKRELIEKQKPLIELYRTMMTMRNKFQEMEGRNLPLEDLKIIEYPELGLMDEKQKEAEQEKLKEMKTKLNNSPAIFLELCRQILDEKCGILDTIFDDEGEWSQDDLIRKIQNYKEQSTLLEGRIEALLKEEEGKMREMIKDWFQIAKNRLNEMGPERDDVNEALEAKLQETEHKLKQALADLNIEKNKKNKELSDKNKDLEKELNRYKEKFHESSKALEEERTRNSSQKDRQSTLEHKMKVAKLRMKEAETQKQDLEVKVDQLNELMKKHSEEWKSKEIYFEAKNKDLQNAVKIHKEEVDKLARERHALDVRLSELQEEFQSKENNYADKIQQLEFTLNEIKNQKASLETEYDVLRVQSVNSEIFNHLQKENLRKNLDNDSCVKSAAETALWQELKETRSALRLANEKLAIYADEKTRFLNTINENFVDDTPANMTAVLMQKEQLISTLILQNKQLKKTIDETNAELETKCSRIKELEEKFQNMNDQIFQSDIDTEKEIYDLHAKYQCEVEHNKELEEQLLKAHDDNKNIKEMLIDYENLLKIRDGLLNMMQEKRQATEQQNITLKDYIVQMREQLNMLNLDKSKKEQDVKTLTHLLEEKTGYIDKIEDRVAELESSVQELKNKRVMLQEQISNADGELRVTRDKISRLSKRPMSYPAPTDLTPLQEESPSREHLQQFISHAQNLHTQEVIRFRKRLRSRMALQNLESTSTGLTRSTNRPVSAQSCQLQRKTKTKIITTVSDIMRRYKSNEGFDLKYYPSSSTTSI